MRYAFSNSYIKMLLLVHCRLVAMVNPASRPLASTPRDPEVNHLTNFALSFNKGGRGG